MNVTGNVQTSEFQWESLAVLMVNMKNEKVFSFLFVYNFISILHFVCESRINLSWQYFPVCWKVEVRDFPQCILINLKLKMAMPVHVTVAKADFYLRTIVLVYSIFFLWY
jgi:hypothetical protein